MKVLFLTGEFPPLQGGVGDCTNEIARALVALGIETHVLTTLAPGVAAESQEGGVAVHRAVSRWGWSSVPQVGRWIQTIGADVVHIQYQTGAFGMHPAINLTPRMIGSRVPFVTTFHDLRVPYLFPKAGAVRDWVTFELARSSRAAVATNEEDLTRLEGEARRAELIPIGSNIVPDPPPGYDPAAWRAKLGVGPGEILLSYFGFLNESKGGETVVRALAGLEKARLIFIGGQVGASDATNERYLQAVQSLMHELKVDSHVQWTGFIPPAEVSADLLASDMCVLPFRDGASFRRGSLMAALAHGLAIITTTPRFEVAGTRSSTPRLAHGENVWLVPPDHPAALAEAVRCLANAPELRGRLGRGALDLARAFAWPHIAARHLELYNSLTLE